jgi:hypothetical protein
MHPAVTLCVINAANAASDVQRSFAAGDWNSPATENIITGLRIDEHDIALIGLILKTKTKRGNRKTACGGVARGVSRGAGDRGSSYRELLA